MKFKTFITKDRKEFVGYEEGQIIFRKIPINCFPAYSTIEAIKQKIHIDVENAENSWKIGEHFINQFETSEDAWDAMIETYDLVTFDLIEIPS
jgi:hypothetical protein